VSFRDPATGDYISAEKARLTEEQAAWHWQQSEQENRRLLYVAITRAVYKCYIFRSESSYNRSSTLAVFLKALEAAPPLQELIRFEAQAPEASAIAMRPAAAPQVWTPAAPVAFSLLEENWRKMSYTMLAAKPEPVPRARAFQLADEYDSFIFNTLRRGAKTGNFLHFIFEKIHFDNDSKWDHWLTEGIRRFVPQQEDTWLPMLRRLLDEVLNADIVIEDVSFRLSSVAFNKRIAEFEFDFPVPLFEPAVINSFSDKQVAVSVKSVNELAGPELEGIMNGKMDLFFEQDGLYYVLDWKSNYLGPSVQDYAPAALAAAMNESNYHLQYLIYTLAAKKYLESRIAGFDYETQFGGVIYMFVRGIRAGSNTGIFTVKPVPEKIQAFEELFSK
jgi:exodeoxyribonuclease V beta subunit